ncbi:MAG: hypothetical protein IT290_05225, partial [Deltaproteobacteria bacterium]|nr:hypothetical protein [Deltaproteobacteria bacterium]
TLPTPWGSGPNPDQAFIVTIDESIGYAYEDFAKCAASRSCGREGRNLKPLREMIELEIEFERNVSTEVEKMTKDGNVRGAKSIEEVNKAFENDQRVLKNSISSWLSAKNVDVVLADTNKLESMMGTTQTKAE